ncbi:MAG: hypothetical protein NVS9B8_04160 [Candidatus Limnocylindrales bacterium]
MHLIPNLDRELPEWGVLGGSEVRRVRRRIVDDEIESALLHLDAAKDCLGLVVVAVVAWQGDPDTAEIGHFRGGLRDRSRSVTVTIAYGPARQVDGKAGFAEPEGNASADAAAGSRYEGDSSFMKFHRLPPPRSVVEARAGTQSHHQRPGGQTAQPSSSRSHTLSAPATRRAGACWNDDYLLRRQRGPGRWSLDDRVAPDEERLAERGPAPSPRIVRTQTGSRRGPQCASPIVSHL